MSNKKNAKASAQPSKQAHAAETVKKKPTKAIIAVAAAAAVIIAAVLVGIFVIKPAIDKNQGTPDGTDATQPSNANSRYTFVDYKGVQMAKELADILVQAEKDNEESCKKYGVAMKIGEREISKNLLALYYLDQYRMQMTEINYAIEQRGSNVTGYDPMVLPDQQKHLNDDYTWAEDFLFKAAKDMQTYYSVFDAAIKNGTTLTDGDINEVMQLYGRVNEYVLDSGETPDERVAAVYGEGTTFAMFAAREIINTYAYKYETRTLDEYRSSLTEEQIEKECQENANDYKVIKARVYPIENEYDAVEISKINTEEEFLEFAVSNSSQPNYNAEVMTQNFYVPQSTLESTFGPEVAEWAFDSKRVDGDVGIVRGMLYEYLVYIESVPFFSTTRDVIVYEYYFLGDENAETLEERYYEVEELYNSWKGLSKEEFLEACINTGYGSEKDVRTGEYYYEVNNWILDSSRKEGDSAFFADKSGLYIVYFVKNNPDDFDWKTDVRNAMGTEKYNAEYNENLKNYEVEYFDDVIKKMYKTANIRISENIKKAQKEEQ